MDRLPPLFAVLRQDRTWAAELGGLSIEPDGSLSLARVPGSGGAPIDLPGPFASAPSGIAIGRAGDVYLSVTSEHRLVWKDSLCAVTHSLPSHDGSGTGPGEFAKPSGIALGPNGRIYVADSGNGRIVVLQARTLTPVAIWAAGMQQPTAVAVGDSGRVYVLDRGLKTVLGLTPFGSPDPAFAISGSSGMASPAFLALGADDTLCLSDDAINAVFRFDADGKPLTPLAGGANAPQQPRALGASAERLYVADAASGRIHVRDLSQGIWLGALPSYRGPVAALAVHLTGDLYVKPSVDETFHRLEADVDCIAGGDLVAGPFDAGEGGGWFRIKVEAEEPIATSITLSRFASNNASAVPTASDWVPALAPDALVDPTAGPHHATAAYPRHLWLKISVSSEDGHRSPRLRQVQAETVAHKYIDHLPPLYARADADTGFLDRFLALLRAFLGDLEHELDGMPRRFDPAISPPDHLAWLASWLAFELPSGKTTQELRALLLTATQLYARRGTPHGLLRFVEIYTGIRPWLFETFRQRRIWRLDASGLGVDTGLPPIGPDGIVVPDPSVTADSENRCNPPIVGRGIVGADAPLPVVDYGETLFGETAHRFAVLIPPGAACKAADKEWLCRIIEAEKPAHTTYALCFVEPAMRVGVQGLLGIDSLVAGPPPSFQLDESTLGVSSFAGASLNVGPAGTIGQLARIGRDTVIG